MVRTRIAPSPTGEDLHIGNLYTAFFNWAWAKKNQGQFIVRVEDTDQTRLVEGSEERILKTLDSFRLSPDESPKLGGPYGPYRQSERLDLYSKYAEELIEKGAAYRCYCTKERLDELRQKQILQKKVPKYDKNCLKLETRNSKLETEKYVIRLNVPENNEVTFHDEIRGAITFNTNDIDDQVLIKSDGFPTYHLAVVVDDHLMQITHVIRAEEWISSTPKHVLLYQALGWELPIFAHVPILRNPDRSKLSKRKNPVWASWYLQEGYLPEAILNYLALMGWSHPEQKEIFSIDEFVSVFDLKDVSSVGPVFDLTKLTWMNGEYIRAMEVRQLADSIFNFHKDKYPKELIEKTVPLIQERIKTLKEYDDYCRFFIEPPEKYLSADSAFVATSAKEAALAKVGEIDLSQKKEILTKTKEALEKLDQWELNDIGETMQQVARDLGVKNSDYFMVMRVAITGKKVSPPLNESMEILGKEASLKRLI